MAFDPNINEDWSDSKLSLCTPDNFDVSISLRGDIEGVSEEHIERLNPKLEMVTKLAAKLSGNMLKGTLKYRRDGWDVDTWIGYLLDDASDALNYAFLLADAREKEKAAESPLGVLQGFRDAWDEVHQRVMDKPWSHFYRAIEIQMEELNDHIEGGHLAKAKNEAADIVSVALNIFRWLGCDEAETARILKERADNRMKGQAAAIMDKYAEKFGI